jgi:hypothetical protein
MPDSMLRSALLVSAAVHGLFGMWVEVRGLAHAPVFREIADSWTGPGIEVDAVPVVDPRSAEAANASSSEKAAPGEVTEPAPLAEHDESAAPAPHRMTTTRGEQSSHKTVATHAGATVRTPTPRPASDVDSSSTKLATAASSGAPSRDGAASNVPSGTASAASSAGTASGAFGAQGLPIGVRHLPKAFTRALSIADRSDPRWLTLAPGPAGEARVEIAIDEDGKLGELAYRNSDERDRLAPVVRHLLENTRLLLESGHFSIDATALRAGVQRLRVRVEIVERAGGSDPDADPNELKELEYEAPTATKPGRGSFALNSGRRVIGWVYLE